MTFARVTKKSRAHLVPEAELQKLVCAFLDSALPKTALWFAVPNGGTRNLIEAVNMKRQGVKAGVPDLIVMWDSHAYGIELKRSDQDLNPNQRLMHARFQDARIPVAVCRSVNEVENFLRDSSLPLRAKAA